MPSKSVNASGETRCQRRAKPRDIGEGVETGWGPPDRSARAGRAGEGEGTVQPTNVGSAPAAAKAEVGWDQKSPGSSPGGATQRPGTLSRASGPLFFITSVTSANTCNHAAGIRRSALDEHGDPPRQLLSHPFRIEQAGCAWHRGPEPRPHRCRASRFPRLQLVDRISQVLTEPWTARMDAAHGCGGNSLGARRTAGRARLILPFVAFEQRAAHPTNAVVDRLRHIAGPSAKRTSTPAGRPLGSLGSDPCRRGRPSS